MFMTTELPIWFIALPFIAFSYWPQISFVLFVLVVIKSRQIKKLKKSYLK